jgi:hypothetical protein
VGTADRRLRDGSAFPSDHAAGSGSSAGSRVACPGATGRRGCCLIGGSTRVYGGSTRWQGHLGWFAGPSARGRELPGTSGRMSPSLPDDGAPRCGCCNPALACSSIPADLSRRSRRSVTRISRTARRRRRCSLAGCPPGRPFVVLAWTGDGPPIWWCTTRMGVQVPPRTHIACI